MSSCPRCTTPLDLVAGSPAMYRACQACGGRLITLPALKKSVPDAVVRRLWLDARRDSPPRGLNCPECGRPMMRVQSAGDSGPPSLDACTHCQAFWFDGGEYEQLPNIPRESRLEDRLTPEAREKIGMAEVEEMRLMRATVEKAPFEPQETWQWLPGFLGMPIESELPPVQRKPLVTWTIGALMVVVSLIGLLNPETSFKDWGMMPAQAGRHGGLTVISSFFLHGSLMHLLGNLWFLLLFGDNVEEQLGKGKYLLLLLLATLLGDLCHWAADPGSTVVLVGASGGISGVIACYTFSFPKARLNFMLGWWMGLRWIGLPAWGWFALWIGMQLLGAWFQLKVGSNVSSLAHLGGAAAGMLFWAFKGHEE